MERRSQNSLKGVTGRLLYLLRGSLPSHSNPSKRQLSWYWVVFWTFSNNQWVLRNSSLPQPTFYLSRLFPDYSSRNGNLFRTAVLNQDHTVSSSSSPFKHVHRRSRLGVVLSLKVIIYTSLRYILSWIRGLSTPSCSANNRQLLSEFFLIFVDDIHFLG